MEREVFGTILEQREEEQKASRNVATSQHREVPTLRRPNVATSQRRDVGSIRRGSQQVANVVTSQRRDVSANSVSTSLKAKGPKIKKRDRKTYGRGHGKPRSSEPDQWRRQLLLYFLIS